MITVRNREKEKGNMITTIIKCDRCREPYDTTEYRITVTNDNYDLCHNCYFEWKAFMKQRGNIDLFKPKYENNTRY